MIAIHRRRHLLTWLLLGPLLWAMTIVLIVLRPSNDTQPSATQMTTLP